MPYATPHPPIVMQRATFFSVATLFASVIWACSTGDGSGHGDNFGPPDGGENIDGGGSEAGPQPTDIVFGSDVTFAKRSCSVTIQSGAGPTSVKVAGEFTGWAANPIALSSAGGGFEVTLAPGPNLTAGNLYGYKLVVDGSWQLDPANQYRKILDGQMNSAFKMPACNAGPELSSGHLSASASGASGEMHVRVTVRSADDAVLPTRMSAMLDQNKLPAGSWSIDAKSGAVDFKLTDLPKGKHTLRLRAFDAKDREADPIDLPFWIEDEAFDLRDGLLYMFMIDRFANGASGNDQPAIGTVDYDADWHGGDLEGALAVAKTGYFDKLGVRTIWLSPVNAQTSKSQVGDGNQIFSAYHGYWPVKAHYVEPRFGGGPALKAFVEEAHKRGIRVVIDLINNQVHEDHEYLASHGDWFRHSCKCGDDANGCGWSQRPFDCMFQPYLPDIDWTKSQAEKQFIDDAVKWITDYDIDGFRVDAVKHVEDNAVYNMRAELSRRFEQGGARIFMLGETAVGEGDSGTFFGEHFADGFAWIDAYTGPYALDGQFDFPTRHNMADGLVSGLKPLSEVESEIQKSLTRYRPDNRHVRFLNGHDNPRIATIAAQDPKLGCAWSSGCRGDQLPPVAYTDPVVYARLKRALTVLVSMPGVPYLYSGDEIAMPGGLDPDMRRDMRFAETELAALQMKKPGAAVATLSGAQIDLRDWMRALGTTRAGSRALRRGDRKTLLGNEGDLWVYAYAAGPKEIAVVAVNRGAAVNRMISPGTLSLTGISGWKSPLGTGSLGISGTNLVLTLGAGEAAIFIPQ